MGASSTLRLGAPYMWPQWPKLLPDVRTAQGKLTSQPVVVLADGPGLVAVCKPPHTTSKMIVRQIKQWLYSNDKTHEISVVSRLDKQSSGVFVAAVGGEGSAACELARAQF